MDWLTRVAATIFPFSLEQGDIAKALSEWFYTGDTYDLDEACEVCQLCGHDPIRYQFTIRKRHTFTELLIGSECITRFDIHAVDAHGIDLDSKTTKQIVARDRQKLITDAKKRRMISALIELKKKDVSVDIDSFLNYYCDRDAFTPKQLSLLVWKLCKNAIPYNPADFKMTIRRKREQEQLLGLQEYQIKQIWPCMSNSQIEWFDRESSC